MDAELLELCTSTAYYSEDSSRDQYGTITWGAPVAFMCRHTQSASVVWSPSGQQIVTLNVLHTPTPIEQNWRIWLPGVDETDGTLALEPKAVVSPDDEYGIPDHYKVTL